jgi:putative oxidoreductase
MRTLRRIAVWAGAIFLAVVFFYTGISKLGGASAIGWAARFGRWGYPVGVSYLVGVIEILGGMGVLIPRWRRAASLTLVAVMVAASVTHLVNAEFPRVIPPVVLGGLAFLIYRSGSRSTEGQT